MQTTSALYKSILSVDHEFVTKLVVHGSSQNYDYAADKILSITRTMEGISNNAPTIGAAISATIELSIIKPSFTVPRRGQIDVLVQATDGSRVSEWIPVGSFFVDNRKENKTRSGVTTLDIIAYDAMIKAEQDYPDTQHDWPYKDKDVVAEIATAIGVTVDPRTNTFITAAMMIDLPSDYTMREVLGFIAGRYAGNFVISPAGKLLFVPLYGFDAEETGRYLADENGNALTFGNEGWCIFV